MEIKELGKNETINLVIKQDLQEEEGISLKEIFDALKCQKRVITVFVLLAFIISVIASTAYLFLYKPHTGTLKALISFNYDGVEKGLDPHGKILEIDKIKSPVVLDRVMDSLNLYERKLTTEDLRKNIDIQGIVPDDIVEKILTINKMAEKDVTKLEKLEELDYHPTQYLVIFNIDRNLGLSSSEAKTVLNEILHEYRKYFFETYGDKDVLSSAIGELNYEEYDYPEIARVMRGQLNIIRSYLSDKQKKSPDFRAKSTQKSFGDIISYINILEDVDVSRMSSLISSYNLTKDKNRLISLYQYRIEQYEVELAKKKDEALMAQEAIDKYQKDKNLVVVPGIAGETGGMLELEGGDEYYDQLVERALTAGATASDLQHEIEYFNKVIEKLNNDQTSDELKQKYMKEADKLVAEVSDKLREWIDITNQTVDEYFETEVFSNAVKIPIQAEYKSALPEKIKQVLTVAVVAMLVGAFVGGVVVIVKNTVLS